MPNRLAEIRRFPVKSMGGEACAGIELTPRGLDGDRVFAVLDGDGRFASGKNGARFRRRDGIFGYRAWTETESSTDAGGREPNAPGATVMVARERTLRAGERGSVDFSPDAAGPWRADDPALAAELCRVLGDDVAVYRAAHDEFYDAAPVSIVGTATVAWAASEFGVEQAERRLRANLVVETSQAFEEETWVRSVLAIGAARLGVTQVISRCRMIDLPQDGVEHSARFLQQLAGARGPLLAVYASVLRPGPIAVGDAVDVDW